MLTSLTPEQEALIPVVHDEWMAKIIDPDKRLKLNKEKAAEGVKWLYKFCGEQEPVIWFMDSPLGCQIAANVLKMSSEGKIDLSNIERNIWSNIERNIRSNIMSNIWSNIERNIESNIRSNIMSNIMRNIRSNIESNIMSNIMRNIWSNIESNIMSNIMRNIWRNIRRNIWSNIMSNIRSNIESNIWRNKMEFFTFGTFAHAGIYGWCGYVDYFRRIKAIETPEGFDNFLGLLESGVYDMIQLKGICIVCPMPEKLERVGTPDNMVLHSEGGKAIQWPDGYGEHYLFGVHFDEKLYKAVTRKNVKAKTVLEIENMDQRTAALKLMGPEKLLENIDAEHISTSDRGNGLYKIPKSARISDEDLYMLKYRDIKTPRIYVAFVPLNADDMGTDGLDPVQKELFEEKWKGKPVAATSDPDLCMAFRHLMTKEEYASLSNET